MKKSISMQQQPNIWLRKTTDKHHVVRLRRNHETFEVEHDDEVTTYWRCDEIELRLPIRENVEQYVEDNFDMLFDIWVNEKKIFNPDRWDYEKQTWKEITEE